MNAIDARLVFYAETVELAQRVASLLSDNGFPCEVVELVKAASRAGPLGILESVLDPLSASVSIAVDAAGARIGGIDPVNGAVVQVVKLEDAPRAREFISVNSLKISTWRAELTICTTCEECGGTSAFPPSMKGTVQNCRHCRRYVDVPNPDDTTEWPADFGSPEDGSEPTA